MPRRLMAYLIAAWAAFVILAPACVAEPAFPVGLRIGIEPPGDLKPSVRFSGFEDADRKVAITILDLPAGAYGELERAATAKAQPGFAIKRENFSFRSGSGQLFSGSAQVNGVTLHKWILLAVAADKDLTAMIDVEVPEAALKVYSDAAVRKALASVTFRAAPIQEQLGLLPFKLGELAGFRVLKVIPAGGVLLTEGTGDDLSKQPYVIVSIGRGSPEAADDRPRFARDLLSTAPLSNIRLQSADSMRIGGSPGYEIRAEAQGPNGEPVMVAQWLRFSGDGYVRVVGVGRKEDWDAVFTRFRAVRDGIEIR
ncbi:MAG TPA: hypothetical protein VMG39_03175 [Pseudolabrys sp.]|nr:hypothetical protein [Pseudolabrys sp.]